MINDVCKKAKICRGTLKNWISTGKVSTPHRNDRNMRVFDDSMVNEIVEYKKKYKFKRKRNRPD